MTFDNPVVRVLTEVAMCLMPWARVGGFVVKAFANVFGALARGALGVLSKGMALMIKAAAGVGGEMARAFANSGWGRTLSSFGQRVAGRLRTMNNYGFVGPAPTFPSNPANLRLAGVFKQKAGGVLEWRLPNSKVVNFHPGHEGWTNPRGRGPHYHIYDSTANRRKNWARPNPSGDHHWLPGDIIPPDLWKFLL